jgi:hypothetical protein
MFRGRVQGDVEQAEQEIAHAVGALAAALDHQHAGVAVDDEAGQEVGVAAEQAAGAVGGEVSEAPARLDRAGHAREPEGALGLLGRARDEAHRDLRGRAVEPPAEGSPVGRLHGTSSPARPRPPRCRRGRSRMSAVDARAAAPGENDASIEDCHPRRQRAAPAREGPAL